MTISSNSNIILHSQAQTFKSCSYEPAPNKCTNSIQTLIDQLRASPFIVTAKLGPEVYTDTPFELKDKINGIPVYGWKPNSTRKETTDKCFFVLGAEVRGDKELVYYSSAQCDRFEFGNYRRHPADQKIYVVTLKRFKESVGHFVLPSVPKPSFSAKQVVLTPEETVWFEQFLKFPINTILGERKAECKALAQEAFNAFKEQFCGDSILAKEALANICDAMLNSPTTRQYHGDLARAWNGVGDETDHWQP